VSIEFSSAAPEISDIPVPCFQPLERICGSLDEIYSKIEELKSEADNAWLEIEYTGAEIVGNLRELLDEAISGTHMEIRRVKNKKIIDQVIKAVDNDDTLDDLDAYEVFQRRLDSADVPETDRAEMLQAYDEVVRSLEEEDANQF
jgi:exonuclease SbcD